MKKFLCVFIFLILLIGVLVAIENGYLKPLFMKIGVYPTQEKYTALFFDQSDQLTHDANESILTGFTFGVTNQEGEDLNYELIVEAKAGSETFTLDNRLMYVRSGETVLQRIDIDPQKYPTNTIFYVLLPTYKKSINFQLK